MPQKRLPVKSEFVPDIDISAKRHVFDLAVNNYPYEGYQNAKIPFHYHDNIEMNFVEKGAATYMHCNRFHKIEEGQMAVFWAGYPHKIFSGDDDLKMWWVTIPLHHFMGWKFPQSFVRKLMLGEIIAGKKTAPELDLAMMQRWKDEIDKEKYRPIILLEIEARLRRLEVRMSRSQKIPFDHKAPNMESLHPSAIKMAAFIIENFQSELPLRVICEHVKLNESYAARLFKQNFGNTLGNFLQEVRVSNAISLLQNTSAKVIDVAYESGFQSTSRFYAAFKTVTGKQPKDYRLLKDYA